MLVQSRQSPPSPIDGPIGSAVGGALLGALLFGAFALLGGRVVSESGVGEFVFGITLGVLVVPVLVSSEGRIRGRNWVVSLLGNLAFAMCMIWVAAFNAGYSAGIWETASVLSSFQLAGEALLTSLHDRATWICVAARAMPFIAGPPVPSRYLALLWRPIVGGFLAPLLIMCVGLGFNDQRRVVPNAGQHAWGLPTGPRTVRTSVTPGRGAASLDCPSLLRVTLWSAMLDSLALTCTFCAAKRLTQRRPSDRAEAPVSHADG